MTYDSTVLARTDLVHYYPLGETIGTSVRDSVGALTGTSSAFPAVTLNQKGHVDREPSYYFDGSGEVSFSGLIIPSTGPWGVDFWFKAVATSGTIVKMSDRNEIYLAAPLGAGEASVRISRPSAGGGPYAYAGDIQLDAWYYCVACFDGFASLSIDFYDSDGVAHGGGTGGTGSPTGTTPKIGNGANGHFTGYVQKVGFYTNADTACRNNFSAYTPIPTSGNLCTSGFTLPGSYIQNIETDAQAMRARTHRQSAETETEAELWYKRDNVWHLFPIQPVTGPTDGLTLTQAYRQPATLEFTLPDPDGKYAPENLDSSYNQNAANNYDPLLDEARMICLRVGTHCYRNLASNIVPTSSLAPSAGALSLCTDGLLYDIANSIAGYVEFAPTDTTPFILTVDLGSSQLVKHAAIRFATNTLTATCTLPASVQISVSSDNITYRSRPARPVGGDGTLTGAPGDWEESNVGNTIEIAFCDLEASARYVRFTIQPVGAQTILIDELAVYGSTFFATLGCNLFTGYLGDSIDIQPNGQIKIIAVDVMKKLADNNDVFLTGAYRQTTTGIELADIAYSLLTAGSYWKGDSIDGYDAPVPVNFIGWESGSSLTGLQYPLWQGQSNSILGYEYELFHVVGWQFFADGNGVYQATQPPYGQRLPDRVCISASDGNYDVRECNRKRTGKEMRNRVIVQTGKSKASGAGTTTLYDPNSLARFGPRTTKITDPLAATQALRQKVASYFLRDYAWNLQTLTNTIRPDYNTRLKQIFGFRAPARPSLYAKASSSVVTGKRKQELWSLVGITHNITYGSWTAQANWIPYVVQPVDAPTLTELNFVGGHSDEMSVVYTDPTDPNAVLVHVYLSTTNELSGFSVVASATLGSSPILLTGLAPGEQIWAYMTAVDRYGAESRPSITLSAIPGSTSESTTCYTITDFAVSSILTTGPDSQGFYTYQFLCLWTAPTCGNTHNEIRGYIGDSPPVYVPHAPAIGEINYGERGAWPIHDDSWTWWAPDRILAGLTWDNMTPGQLDFTVTFRSTTHLSGVRIYWRIWNSVRTREYIPVTGNYSYCIIM